MKEKRHKKSKKNNKDKSYPKDVKKKRRRSTSDSSNSGEWEEKRTMSTVSDRDGWMSMTGNLKTYTKEDIKPKRETQEKKNIDSYNPTTSSRELNPYWKDGGAGVPQTQENFTKSRQFIKPSGIEDYYSKSNKASNSKEYNKSELNNEKKNFNWRLRKDSKEKINTLDLNCIKIPEEPIVIDNESKTQKSSEPQSKEESSLYLSDEKMNKLAAKIVKAEIMGDIKVTELKAKLEAAREYRKKNPNTGTATEYDGVMLLSTNSRGHSMPLVNNSKVSHKTSIKRKSDTHDTSGRVKYYGNDDKYDLTQMFQQEKYGSNFNDEAELARIASKSKNPNDDLEDIFLDDISKNRNPTKENEKDKQQAINQNIKLEKSLEGCEYCFDSKNMLKHLIVSCGNKIYMSLPAKKSLVKGHCILSTILHATCVTNLDEDIWEEILNYRKMITKFYNSQNQDVVFFETATKLHRFPHMVINCVPLPRDVGDMASIYFKKALIECEAEWSMNKKVVDLKGKNVRKCIPKGLPYFWIDFGMEPGFAHVIEDQQLFPKIFAEEIIGGMLDLDHSIWKNPKKEYGDIQRKKVLDFIKDWKPFEESYKGN